jgi:hypothetical protein
MQPWNAAVIAETKALLSHFQRWGKVRKDLDVDAAAIFFNKYENVEFIRLVMEAEPDRGAHADHMRTVLNLMCQGILTKSAGEE